jgi:O-antigen/teichoic acid export membrane protein
MYSTEDLSFYNRGKQFPDFIVSNINTSIDSVLLPTLSKEQDDSYRVKSMTRRAIVTSTYIMAPLMIGLACCAESMVKLILTEKWMGCVPYLRVFCITFIFYPIHTANLNAIKAVGRSDLFLKLEIAKKIVGFIILFSTMWYGTMVMTYSLLLSSVLGQLINTWPNRKLLNYGYIEQLKDIMPSVILAFTMGILVYMLKFLPLATALVMVTQIIVGIVYYFLISKIFHFEPYIYILNTIKSFKNKMK